MRLAIGLLLLSSVVLAKPTAPQDLQFTTSDECRLKVQYFEGKFKDVLLLLPGFTENRRVWRDFAKSFQQQGFHVYIAQFRGQGPIWNRSRCDNKNYDFDYWASIDLPELTLRIYEKHGEKIQILGHSMGGMAAKLAVSGLNTEQGRFFIDETRRSKMIQSVRSLVSLGSPTQFQHSNLVLDLMRSLQNGHTEILNFVMTSIGLDLLPRIPFVGDFLLKSQKKLIENFARSFVLRNALQGLLFADNFSRRTYELSEYLVSGTDFVEDDVIQNVERWLDEGYSSRDGRVVYRHLQMPEEIQKLYIAGKLDDIADFEDMRTDFRRQNSPKALIGFQATSHVDLLVGQRAHRILFPVLNSFLQNSFSNDFKRRVQEEKSLAFYE